MHSSLSNSHTLHNDYQDSTVWVPCPQPVPEPSKLTITVSLTLCFPIILACLALSKPSSYLLSPDPFFVFSTFLSTLIPKEDMSNSFTLCGVLLKSQPLQAVFLCQVVSGMSLHCRKLSHCCRTQNLIFNLILCSRV